MRRPLALAAALLAAACAAPAPTAPGPAARFEPGGGTVREIKVEQARSSRFVGEWIGTYRPIDMGTLKVTPETAGRALLIVDSAQGSLLRGSMEWETAAGETQEPMDWVGALTLTGHFMVMNAHAILFEQDGVEFLEIDMQRPDGRFYRHRLTRRS